MRRSRLLATLALALAVVAFPLGALASHDFADVPDSNPFHADISALVAAGVTSGCGGGNYCPSANVTREQMAAFMNRLGALAPGKTPVVNATKLDGLDSSQFVRSDTEHLDQEVCSSAEMQTDTTADQWVATSYLKYLTSAGPAEFSCVLDLPTNATIIQVTFYVYDASTTENIGTCLLHRQELGANSGSLVASAGPTTDPFNGGITSLSTTTITTPIVDNSNYAYVAGCTVEGDGSDIGVLNYAVIYSFNAPFS